MKLKLKQYLVKLAFEEAISSGYFAKKMLRCSPQHLSAVITGRHHCGEKLAEDIEKATKGAVTKEYMLEKEYDYGNLPLDGVTSRKRGK